MPTLHEHIHIYPNEPFVIILPTNPSTGYTWVIKKQPHYIKLLGNLITPRDVIGAPTNEYWLWTVKDIDHQKGKRLIYEKVGPNGERVQRIIYHLLLEN